MSDVPVNPGPSARTEFGSASSMPSLFRAADRASGRGQHDFLFLTVAGLACLAIAAAAGAFHYRIGHESGPDLFGIIASAMFFGAVAVRAHTLSSRSEKAWYEGRAIAESAKTLAWRYAVGAQPFPLDAEGADELFIERLRDVMGSREEIALEPDVVHGDQITAAMRAARASSLLERRRLYRVNRIEDQRDWYASRARKHGDSARHTGTATLLAECGGFTLSLLKVGGVVEVDFLAIAAAVASGLIAWERANQYSLLRTAYSVAAQELVMIDSLIESQDTEAKWSDFVSRAEEAISREHTLWRASRTDRAAAIATRPAP